MLVGTNTGSILEIVKTADGFDTTDLMESHDMGEVWGMCLIDEEDSNLYLTSGDDNKLLLYDIELKKVIGRGTVMPDNKVKSAPKKKKIGGASTMSKKPVQQ
eukprot:CAMPEP_0176398072 /NCGR_PEP_ID=MMETSP0126-20121128/45639_1 /TAXON_ID=141414 ORGANISM="Strombidinopsis acuminatum, Strain SPMC142" /NCGR_SAMPLE_ID=MMETSP0126 /ASSEMBLY_ACC=CAM_ASM_000229 /LENGTH=101 /DNA_ID=CAMNT_0017772777 /DNA_START=301 /DNA_END=606 /DNA_ORIENTATION=-